MKDNPSSSFWLYTRFQSKYVCSGKKTFAVCLIKVSYRIGCKSKSYSYNGNNPFRNTFTYRKGGTAQHESFPEVLDMIETNYPEKVKCFETANDLFYHAIFPDHDFSGLS